MDLKTDRTPAVLTTSELILLAHLASYLATLFDPALPPGCSADPAELTNVELTAPSNKVNLFQYLVQNFQACPNQFYCLQRHGRPLKNPSASASQVKSLLFQLLSRTNPIRSEEHTSELQSPA